MFRSLIFVCGTLLLVGTTGCASIAAQKERQLSAAGFQMKMADSAEKESHLASLQQYMVFPAKMGGQRVYVYADAKNCNCMYVGSESDYQRYRRLVMAKHELDGHPTTADDALMQWDTWGPWVRPVY